MSDADTLAPEAIFARGREARLQGEPATALADLNRQLGDRARALGYFEQAASADPRHLEAFMQAGWDLRALGRLEDAVRQFECALGLVPGHADATNALRAVAREIEDRARA